MDEWVLVAGSWLYLDGVGVTILVGCIRGIAIVYRTKAYVAVLARQHRALPMVGLAMVGLKPLGVISKMESCAAISVLLLTTLIK